MKKTVVGKIAYFFVMCISFTFSFTAFLLPRWSKALYVKDQPSYRNLSDERNSKSDSIYTNLLDTQIQRGFDNAIYFYCVTAASVFLTFFAILNFLCFGLEEIRPIQRYLALRRSSVLTCLVFSLQLDVVVHLPFKVIGGTSVLRESYYLFIAADIFAFLGIFIGFFTSQWLYNKLERKLDERYNSCSILIPY